LCTPEIASHVKLRLGKKLYAKVIYWSKFVRCAKSW